MGGGGSCRSLPALIFCPLLKIFLVNPYLKILDLAKLFVADSPIKKIEEKNSFTPSQINLKSNNDNIDIYVILY